MRPDNRVALLRGARLCLDRRGYARTRARDIAAAAEVSTAAIGYHFGTTETLLVQALMDALQEWAARLDLELGAVPQAPGPDRFAELYRRVVESFHSYRGVLAASYELIAQADDHDQVRAQLREAVDRARRCLARQVLGSDADADPERATTVGTACYAMLSGLIVQWLVDPSSLPPPETVATELARLAPVHGSPFWPAAE